VKSGPEKAEMRKFLLVIWLADSAILAFLLGCILLHKGSPGLAKLMGDLGAIWGGSGVWLGSLTWKAKERKIKKAE